MTEFMDKNFVDDKGESLFSDKDRDEKFGRVLREQFGGKKFRGEAFTTVRQKVGQVRTDDPSVTCNNEFEKTQRHVDGQNDGRSSCNHSVVFSAMCCWNSTVHRFTVIMHSRQSCGDWMIKNQKANVMRTCHMDCKNCNNGGLDYEEFHLSKRMI